MNFPSNQYVLRVYAVLELHSLWNANKQAHWSRLSRSIMEICSTDDALNSVFSSQIKMQEILTKVVSSVHRSEQNPMHSAHLTHHALRYECDHDFTL